MQSKGNFAIKLEDLSKGFLPDFKIFEETELNVLVGLGGLLGKENAGSSGAAAGFHVYYRPPVVSAEVHKGVKSVLNFVERKLNFLKRIYLLSDIDPKDMPDPKLPKLPEDKKINMKKAEIPDMSGTEIGFHIAEGGIRFKIDIKEKNVTTFSLLCFFELHTDPAKKIVKHPKY